MKGFIEIHYLVNNTVHKKLISVSNSLNSVDDNGVVHYDCGGCLDAMETYEEIKQKIKEATEPKLIVDGNGNLKEIK